MKNFGINFIHMSRPVPVRLRRQSWNAAPTVVSVTMQDLSQSCYADDSSTLLFKYSDKLPSVTVSGNEVTTTAINNT